MNYTGEIMSTQMKVAQQEAGWTVLNGDRPVAINGDVHHEDRDSLVSEILARGLFVWSDGSISKEAEPVDDSPMVFAQDTPNEQVPTSEPPVTDQDPEPPVTTDEPEPPVVEDVSENQPGYTPPTPGPTEDPPVDPGADPEDPDPNPTVPVKPKKARAPRKPKIAADADKVVEGMAEAKTAARKPRAKKDPDAPRFTPEQKAARAEYAKGYRKTMTEEQKEKARAAARERQKRWRENNPQKAAEFAKKSSERRKERYNEDPEFRSSYRAKQKEYAAAAKSD